MSLYRWYTLLYVNWSQNSERGRLVGVSTEENGENLSDCQSLGGGGQGGDRREQSSSVAIGLMHQSFVVPVP